MLIHALVFAILGLIGSTLLLLLGGRRLGGPAWWGGLLCIAAVAAGSAWAGSRLSIPSAELRIFLVGSVVAGLVVVATCRAWNPIGQAAWLFVVLAGVSFWVVSGVVVFFVPASPVGTGLGVLLWLMQLVGLIFTLSYTFEIIDVTCRRRWRHPEARPPRQIADAPVTPTLAGALWRLPRVALHVPCHEEPPEVVAATLQSLAQLHYPRDCYTVFVVDNNTKDPALWEPLATLCEQYGFTFMHLEDWPGFKSGALNYALTATPAEYTLIGIVDADYLVDPNYLQDLVGYFADPAIAFVQTPQDYRDYADKSTFYQRACYHAYRYFFDLSMPSRSERNAIIFGGTMGLIRRSALTTIGGWDEWCITEDAEASLRLLARGYEGRFVNQSYGRGLMPLEFDALKRQRFRWCFGGIQILRKHWASLLPWSRRDARHWQVPGLSGAQRYHYLLSGVQWFSDVLTLGFTALLLLTGTLFVVGRPVYLPVLGATLAVMPLTFWGVSIVRTLWALRATRRCTWGEALGALAVLWSLSWVVALACLQGIIQRNGVFLRTPKVGKAPVLRALRSTASESFLALACWCVGGVILAQHVHELHGSLNWWMWGSSALLLGIFALLQGGTYATAPILCLLSLRTEAAVRNAQRRAYDAERGLGEWRLLVGALAIAGVLTLGIVGTSLLSGPGAAPSAPEPGVSQLLGGNPAAKPTLSPTHGPKGVGTPGPTSIPVTTPTVVGTPGSTPTGTTSTPPTVTLTPTDTPHLGATMTPHPKPTPQPTKTHP